MTGQLHEGKISDRKLIVGFVQKDVAGKSAELAELQGEVSAAVASGGATDGGGHQEIQHPEP